MYQVIFTDQFHQESQEDQKGYSSTCRWVKTALDAAGINTMQFNPHSTRPVSTTAARGNSVSLQEILNTAAWSSMTTISHFMKHVSQLLEQQFATGAFNVAVMKYLIVVCKG